MTYNAKVGMRKPKGIRVRLRKGEYVVNADATNYREALDKINDGDT